MRHESDHMRSGRRGRVGGGRSSSRSQSIRGQDLHIRNYDHRWGYDLYLEVVNEDGVQLFQKRYYLQPGRIESEFDVLPSGEHEVRATLDDSERTVQRIEIDDSPEHTVVIEVGNGALSVTEGL